MATGVELATAWIRLVPSVEGINGEVTKALGGVETEAGKTGDKAGKKFSTGFKLGMTVLAGFVVKEVGGALLGAVNSATDLAEAGTATEAIFGGSYGSISTWAKGAGSALGQSETQALNAAKTFGVYGTAAGLGEEENAKFSTSLAGLASDFASFHNVSPEEAIEAIGSGLRGEAEPLRKFGILLDDASLKAKAMEMGIYDGNGSLDAQTKILASNALIFDQAGVAQGDFARTSEGVANQQRILDASMANLGTTIGTALMPVMSGLLAIAQPLTTWLSENPALVSALAIGMGIFAVVLGVVAAALWIVAAAQAAAFWPITLIVAGIVILIAIIIALAMNWDAVVAWLTSVWQGFTSWLISSLSSLGAWWVGMWAGFGGFVKDTWNGFTNWIKSVWSGFVGWIMGIVNTLGGWWSRFWALFGIGIRVIWAAIVTGVTAIWSGFTGWLMGVVSNLSSWWNGVWSGFSSIINSVWSGIGSFVAGVWNGIVSTIKRSVNVIISTINGMIGALNGVLSGIGGLIGLNIKLPKIPGLMHGGTVTGSGAVLVGERGPELLTLPRGATVDPDISGNSNGKRPVVFNNYAPIGQSPAQALSEFSNRAGGL